MLRDLRNEIRLAVDHGGLSAATSYRDDLEGWYTPLNAFTVDRPAGLSRIEEMIALVEAGCCTCSDRGCGSGPHARDGGFLVGLASRSPGPPVLVRALIEARLPEPTCGAAPTRCCGTCSRPVQCRAVPDRRHGRRAGWR